MNATIKIFFFLLSLHLVIDPYAIALQWQPASVARYGRVRPSVNSFVTKRASIATRAAAADDNDSNRPPIIPFEEFAREDIIIPPKKNEEKKKQPKEVSQTSDARSVIDRDQMNQQPVWLDPDPRPTGYNTPDDDNEEEMEEQRLLDGYVEQIPDNIFVRWFKDTYIGSPYDSRKKQQARYVIRNITIISFAIGFVFTAIWFAFPGKFISYRGDTDFTERYSQSYVDPSNLLENDYQLYKSYYQEFGDAGAAPSASPRSGEGEFLDDAAGLPAKEQTRFAPNSGAPVRAPGRSADL